MKTSIEIPDDLYRQVKAKTALEARSVREVTIELYRSWVAGASAGSASSSSEAGTPPAWFGGARKYAKNVKSHTLKDVRESVVRGRSRYVS